MASIITATTTSGLTQSADNSGVLQLASGTGNLVTIPSVTGTAMVSPQSLTIPDASGTVMVSGNMPTFSAQPSTTQSASSGAYTKVDLGTENWDTNNNFASSRFTPTVAGYYFFSASIYCTFSGSAAYVWASVYKNGGLGLAGNLNFPVTTVDGIGTVNGLLYMNGSTDYVELYMYLAGTSPVIQTGSGNVFSGFLARAA
jgi:hypothetical protein